MRRLTCQTAARMKAALASLCVAALTIAMSPSLMGQVKQIQDCLDSGEFNRAIEWVDRLEDQELADVWRAKIATSQRRAGAVSGSLNTLADIRDNDFRIQSFRHYWDDARQPPSGGDRVPDGDSSAHPNAGNRNAGNRGGITEADFDDLIELIQETIDPDSWEENGGTGRLRPFASGVYVDSQGALQRIQPDSLRDWNRIRQPAEPGDWQLESHNHLARISLNRLETELLKLAAQGQPIPAEIRYLAGMYDLQYVLAYPETGDLVIAGPAGPWQFDDEGRAVNANSGQPVLLLDDLVVCLRNAWNGNGIFGCSIDPKPENLEAVALFLKSTRLTGSEFSQAYRRLMGEQVISVHGIDPGTHAGQVIVEADYRMKLIGMGLEESIPQVPSYLDRIQPDDQGKLPPMDVVRWWFTMNYDGISASPSRDAFELSGPGVKVLSETEYLDEQGQRIPSGQAVGPTLEFARDFTQHFDQLTRKYSIYGELENVFDLSLAANLIQSEGLAERVGWQPSFFQTADSSNALVYQVESEPQPVAVQSVINERTIVQRVNSKTLRHRVIGVSGGVVFDALPYLSSIREAQDGSDFPKALDERPTGWSWK